MTTTERTPRGRTRKATKERVNPFERIYPFPQLAEPGKERELEDWLAKLRANHKPTIGNLAHMGFRLDSVVDRVTCMRHRDGSICFIEVRIHPPDLGGSKDHKKYICLYRADIEGHDKPGMSGESVRYNITKPLQEQGLMIPDGVPDLMAAIARHEAAGTSRDLTVLVCEGAKTRAALKARFESAGAKAMLEERGIDVVVIAWIQGLDGARNTNFAIAPMHGASPDSLVVGANDIEVDWAKDVGGVIIVPDADREGKNEATEVANRFRTEFSMPADRIHIAGTPKNAPSAWDDADPLPRMTSEEIRIDQILDAPAFVPIDDRVPSEGLAAEHKLVPRYAEDMLAQKVAAEHGAHIRYVAAWGKWFVWSGAVWGEDQTGRVVEEFVRGICWREADNLMREDDKKYAKIATGLLSAKAIFSVMKLLQSVRPVPATVDQWDADPWLLNTPGGVVDLKTGLLREHRADDYMTKSTTVTPGGECPKWKAHLTKVMGDKANEMTPYQQRQAGYALTGIISEHCLFFDYGPGRNGKSVKANVYKRILGDYAVVAPSSTFIATHNEQHPTDIARLKGARLVLCSEVERGKRWNEARIKGLTGGDEVTGRFMNRDFFTFRPEFKLLFGANDKPSLRSNDEAIRARFQLTPYEIVIPLQERIADFDRVLFDEEGPGILQWMIAGCIEWQREGLKPPKTVVDASKEYIDGEDVRAAWLEDECVIDNNAKVLVSSLMTSWRAWSACANEYPGTRRELGEWLEARGFQKVKLEKGIFFIGIRLKSDDAFEAPRGQ